ncbi:S41 family peptidase [Polyangium sorediatum]|uniref:S41 family peptidase n=1 Tax=Polyangium sorediatum TaxID=889274 RepID=A0ABT6NN83_9BACT|nr:S41 family peptidase [Polyangium sorediatum]MDI1429769.1 S41 family peptidase [Polyangium sorediatum]
MGRRLATRAWYFAAATAIFAIAAQRPAEPPKTAARGIALWSLRTLDVADEEDLGAECGAPSEGGLVLPTGAPAALSCEAARTIIAQVRTNLAAPVADLEAAKFADGVLDWLDPHGLWSLAPDAPVAPLVRREGERLLLELESAPWRPCAAADVIGASLATWMKTLRASFDEGLREGRPEGSAPHRSPAEVWRTVTAAPFEDGPITRNGRELARELGREVGGARAAYGAALDPFVTAAGQRLFPDLTAEAWGRVVLAAAVRAYVPQLDAHGAWAPLDEEISIYDLDLETNPPLRLWSEMTRTALGIRIDRGALAPLLDGDVVLSVRGVPLTGMSVEQAEQTALIEGAPHGPPASVTILRPHVGEPLELVVTPLPVPAREGPAPPAEPPTLPFDAVRYAEGRVAIVTIADVPDDLGDRVGAALARVRAEHDMRAVLLDLRANGGGSTDGAMAALGHFLPGAALFPMRRRDGGVEVERAPEVSAEESYSGPLAVLVDGDTASAAEMIAGAIGSYRRGVVIGDRTYGKGCAQEYLDDEARAGVLRVTTLLFSLPDGAPVQKVGISPQITLSLPATTEREARVAQALEPWRGPDVRDPGLVREVPWALHGGRVGPCRDETVCRALRALGTSVAAAR